MLVVSNIAFFIAVPIVVLLVLILLSTEPERE